MSNTEPKHPGRDRQGRFTKGTSGNPNGRPKAERHFDESELFVFANTLVDVSAGGSKQLMSRLLATRNKLFACGMKGDARALIYLDRTFAAHEKERAAVRLKYDKLVLKYYLSDFDGEIPIEDELFMQRARAYLHLPDFEPPTANDWEAAKKRREDAKSATAAQAEKPVEPRTRSAPVNPGVVTEPRK